MLSKSIRLSLLFLCLTASTSFASIVTIDFEAFTDATSFENVGDFYSGGTNNAGVQGPDYGIWVGAVALQGPNGHSGIVWEDCCGDPTRVTVEDGFADGFSMRLIRDPDVSVHLTLFDLDGGVIRSELFAPDPDVIAYSTETLGLAFDGIVGSIRLYDSEQIGLNVFVDEMTFGSATPVPVPAAVWLFVGTLGLLWPLRRGRCTLSRPNAAAVL